MAISALAQWIRSASPSGGARTKLRRCAAAFLAIALWPASLTAGDAFRAGNAAYAAHHYAEAAKIFSDLAVQGDPRAQTLLGFMFANGRGVPQNFIVAAGWYRCAAKQGFAAAQYFLGVQYDKGLGVPQDFVMSYALLDLAVASAGPERHYWVKIRDAVLTKLTVAETLQAQQMAFLGPPLGPCLPIVVGY
ncbi:tetratricopeptide repeat protein [Methylocapsa acidiphila]|uniref:tetratricopeptide repeat protein n=1 Tax=Methylocapsa acidiphila TaxID=133552 RepID=UPI000413BB33|nr:tetratricopeptide repeat protein [Methylocapsa acidiphila]